MVIAHEFQVQHLVGLAGHQEGKLLEPGLVAVDPAIAQHLGATVGNIVDVRLGCAGADGDMSHVLVVDIKAVLRNPQGLVGDGRLTVGLAV